MNDVSVTGSDVVSDVFYFEGNHAKGELGERFQCVLEQADLASRVQVLPFQRAKILIQQGKTDVIFPLVRSLSRDSWAFATQPVVTIDPLVVTTDLAITSLVLLEGREVATVRGSVFHELLLTFGATVAPVTIYNQGVDMVLAGRVDAALIPKPLFEQLSEAQQRKLSILNLPSVNIGFYVSNKSDQTESIVKQLDKAIALCSRS
jgi:ABC-type amino acid transport substrate-binding protein